MELNYLLLKPDEQFSESDELLFPPFKNIIINLEKIATHVDSGIGVLDLVRKMIGRNFYSINVELDEYLAELVISECIFRRSR